MYLKLYLKYLHICILIFRSKALWQNSLCCSRKRAWAGILCRRLWPSYIRNCSSFAKETLRQVWACDLPHGRIPHIDEFSWCLRHLSVWYCYQNSWWKRLLCNGSHPLHCWVGSISASLGVFWGMDHWARAWHWGLFVPCFTHRLCR